MVNMLAIIVSICFIIYFVVIDMADMIGDVYNSKISFERKLLFWIFSVMD